MMIGHKCLSKSQLLLGYQNLKEFVVFIVMCTVIFAGLVTKRDTKLGAMHKPDLE